MKFYDAGHKQVRTYVCISCNKPIDLRAKYCKIGSRKIEVTCPYCFFISTTSVLKLLRHECWLMVSSFQIEENMKRRKLGLPLR